MLKNIVKYALLCNLIGIVMSKSIRKNPRQTGFELTSFIDNMSEKYYMRFALLVEENDEYLKNVADLIVKNTKWPIIVRKISPSKKFTITFDYCVLIMSQSQGIFDNVDINLISFLEFMPSKKFFVFWYAKMSLNTPTMFFDDPQLKIPWVHYLLHNDDDGSLQHFHYASYQSTNCKVEITLTSAFDAKKQKWISIMPTFTEEQVSFYKCAIFVGVSNNRDQSEHGVYVKKKENGLVGVYPSLLKLFAEKYNATFEYVFYTKLPSIFGVEALLKDWNIFIYNEEIYKINSETFSVTTTPLRYAYLTFMVSPGQQYTPFEKLILPFDETTWILIIVTFVIGYLTILIVYQCSKNVQKLVFGENIRYPSLGLAQIFFGIGLIQTPGRFFSRFLFMSFTLYCLIVRTAYQGKMFDFLHSTAEKPTPKTWEQLKKSHTPIVQAYDYMKFPFYDDLLVPLNVNDGEKCYEMNATCLVETFGTTPYARLTSRVDYERNDNTESMTIFKDDYFVVPQCWYVKPNIFLIEILDKFILEMHQHGLLKHFEEQNKPPPSPKPDDPGPQILTMYILSAGFIVWIATVAIACFAFAFEHLWFKYSKTTRKNHKIQKVRPVRPIQQNVMKPKRPELKRPKIERDKKKIDVVKAKSLVSVKKNRNNKNHKKITEIEKFECVDIVDD